MKNLKPVLLCTVAMAILSAFLGTGCNGGNSGNSTQTGTTTSSSTQADCVNCSPITPENFVAALVQLGQAGSINASFANSKLIKSTTDIQGSDLFIIWNGDTQSYQAINALSTYSAFCTQPGECSNINPQGAALALANAQSAPHQQTEPFTVVSSTGKVTTGTVTVPDGTETWGYIGTGNAESVVAYPLQPTNELDAQGNPTFQDPYNDGLTYSEANPTRDTDLEQAQLQNFSLLQKAANISSGLQMDFASAVQLTELADTIQKLQAGQNQLSSDDRAAVMQRVQGFAGITADELSAAVQDGLKGDMTTSEALVNKASKNLGMPADTLRNQILPRLGVTLGN